MRDELGSTIAMLETYDRSLTIKPQPNKARKWYGNVLSLGCLSTWTYCIASG